MFTGTNTTGVFGRMGGSPERQEEMENEASKYAVVEAVLKVYDENARLRIENERLKRLNDDIATIAAPTECESDRTPTPRLESWRRGARISLTRRSSTGQT